MPKFVYNFDSSLPRGEIEAKDIADARQKLSEKDVVFINIIDSSDMDKAQQGRSLADLKNATVHGFFNDIKVKEVINFTKSLKVMLAAGIRADQALEMLKNQASDSEKPSLFTFLFTFLSNPIKLSEIIEQIHKDIKVGNKLSESFEKYPNVFDNIYINMLIAAEEGGNYGVFLNELVVSMKKEEKMRKNVAKALRYPMIVTTVAIGVIVVLMIWVVPVFQTMFASVPGGLPVPTQIIVTISEFLSDPSRGGLSLLIIVGLTAAMIYLVKNNNMVREVWHTLQLKLPKFGNIVQQSALSKIAMIHVNLSAAGINPDRILEICKDAMSNDIIKDALDNVEKSIKKGERLSEGLESLKGKQRVFPSTFISMTKAGEESGDPTEMFKTIAEYYEQELDETVSQIAESIEPIMTVVMGLIVGFILAAMYMPMFEIGKTI